MIRLARRSLLSGLLAAGAGADARADQWPYRAVTWIVPFPAGGGSDLFARPIAAHAANRLGQTMVIDNKSGAGGTLGTAVASRASADGYSVLVGDTGLTYAPAIY